MTMNNYQATALLHKHALELQNQANGGNPYHY